MNLNLRPQTLAEVAVRADDQRTFGLELQDWLHTLRALRDRSAIARCIEDEPKLIANRFPEGQTADAWLGSYAEHLATAANLTVPAWTRDRAGRPPVSAEQKRRKNAERQQRFRARRAAELAALRKANQS